jgi:hypothetical protein
MLPIGYKNIPNRIRKESIRFLEDTKSGTNESHIKTRNLTPDLLLELNLDVDNNILRASLFKTFKHQDVGVASAHIYGNASNKPKTIRDLADNILNRTDFNNETRWLKEIFTERLNETPPYYSDSDYPKDPDEAARKEVKDYFSNLYDMCYARFIMLDACDGIPVIKDEDPLAFVRFVKEKIETRYPQTAPKITFGSVVTMKLPNGHQADISFYDLYKDGHDPKEPVFNFSYSVYRSGERWDKGHIEGTKLATVIPNIEDIISGILMEDHHKVYPK